MIANIKEILETQKDNPTQNVKTTVFSDKTLNDLKRYFLRYVQNNFSEFDIDDENRITIANFLLYFSEKEEFEKLKSIKNPSLKKGILLAGNVGSGKTTLMRIMKEMRISSTPFQSKSCREIAQLYVADGVSAIQRYGIYVVKSHHGQWKKQHALFDDLGTERNMSYYGNKLNVMEEILLDRYDHFVKHGLIPKGY